MLVPGHAFGSCFMIVIVFVWLCFGFWVCGCFCAYAYILFVLGLTIVLLLFLFLFSLSLSCSYACSYACAFCACAYAGYNQWGELGLGDKNDRGDEPGEMGDNLEFVDLGSSAAVQSIALGDWHT